MKKWRKALALLLAMVMVLSLAACATTGGNSTEADTGKTDGSSETTKADDTKAPETDAPKEPVLLEWYYRGNGQQEDTDKVEARVNELLKSYPGLEHVSININCFPAADYVQQVTMTQTSGGQIDILNSVSLGSFGQLVADGNWMPMEDYISEDLKNALPDWLWEMGTVDGHIYMVPNYQNAFNMAWIAFPKEYMDKYGNYDEMYKTLSSADTSMEDKMACLEAYALACDNGEAGEKYACIVDLVNYTGNIGFSFVTPYDHLGDGFIVEDGTNKVSFFYENEEYKKIWETYAKWSDLGIFMPDGVATETKNYFKSHMMDEVSMVWTVTSGVGSAEEIAQLCTTEYGFETVVIPIQQYAYVQNTWGAGGNGISSTCEHPEEAALFLECLTTGTELGKEIYNTMVFGLEGEHYTKDANDPNRIVTLEYEGSQGGASTSYAGLKWIIGNTFNAYKNQAVRDGQYESYKEYNESPDTVASSIIGFVADKSNVSVEVDQIKAIVAEYTDLMNYGVSGSDGFEATYNEFMQKLQLAGLEKVKAEYQSQLDAWVAANK